MMKLLLLFILSMHILYAYPTVHTKFQYYLIYPKTKAGLQKTMLKSSPIVIHGKRTVGSTTWQMSSRYKWKSTNGTCYVSHAKVTLDILYTMPKVPNSHQLSTDVKETFDRYYQALLKHEKNHKKYAVTAAKDLERLIRSYRGNCNNIKPYINQQKTKIYNALKKKNRDYDKKTQHGFTEGVFVKNFF